MGVRHGRGPVAVAVTVIVIVIAVSTHGLVIDRTGTVVVPLRDLAGGTHYIHDVDACDL